MKGARLDMALCMSSARMCGPRSDGTGNVDLQFRLDFHFPARFSFVLHLGLGPLELCAYGCATCAYCQCVHGPALWLLST